MLINCHSVFNIRPIHGTMRRPDTTGMSIPAARRAPHTRDTPYAPRDRPLGDGDTSMGRDAAADASRALRLLNHPDLRHHPVHGPTERRSPSTTPAAPLNVGLVDYLARTVDELVTLTRDIAPDAGPLPERLEGLYDWCIEHTGNADADQQAHRDFLFEKQRLEHAVRLGEHNVVCEEPCPGCGRWGLMWDDEGSRARCTHGRCHTPEGLTSTWTLSRLATQKVWRTEIWRRNAT